MISLEASSRDRRAIRIGAAIMFAIAGLRAGPPALQWRRAVLVRANAFQDSLSDARNFSRGYSRIDAHLSTLRSRMKALEVRMITVPTLDAGVVQLTAKVNDLANDAGLRLASVEAVADTNSVGGLRSVQVQAEGTADILGLATLLQLLQGDSLRLLVPAFQVSQPVISAPDTSAEQLHFRLTARVMARLGSPLR